MKQRPIGVFDSGVGGLTVVKNMLAHLPGESLIYFGDTAHVPYGNKSQPELFSYARNIISFLLEQGAKAIVVACNTSSSVTLPELEKAYSVPLLGVVRPGASLAVRVSKNRRIGVMATQATADSRAYSKYIRELDSNCQVFEKACPRLVPLVESGRIHSEETSQALQEYLFELREKDIDTLILGCTHYPFLAPQILKIMGDLSLVDPAMETVRELEQILAQKNLLNDNTKKGSVQFMVSGNDQSFYDVGRLLLGAHIQKVEKVDWVD